MNQRRRSLVRFTRSLIVFWVVFFVVGSFLYITPFSGIETVEAVVSNAGRHFYGDATNLGVTKFQTYTQGNPGSFGAELSGSATTSSAIQFVMAKGAPTRREIVVGQQKADGRLDVQLCDVANGCDLGTELSNSWSVAGIIAANTVQQAFSIAYEQLSGRAMVVYGSNSAAGKLYYCLYDGSSWGPVANCAPTNGTNDITLSDGTTTLTGVARWVRLKARGEGNGQIKTNDIILAVEDANSDIYVTEWNGSSWLTGTNDDVVTTTASSLAVRPFDVGWETLSGNALIYYGDLHGAAADSLDYATYDGSSWSAPSVNTSGQTGGWFAMTSHTYSDRIALIGSISTSVGPQVWKYDGSTAAFTGGNAMGGESTTGENLAVAWEKGNSNVPIAYFAATTANALVTQIQTWTDNGGTGTFSANGALTGNSVDDISNHTLTAAPNSDEIMNIKKDIDCGIRAQEWGGGAWETLITTNLELATPTTTAGCTANTNSAQLATSFVYSAYSPWSTNWKFFADDANNTPATQLAAELATPTSFNETSGKFRLRFQNAERANTSQTDGRKKLQYTSSNPDLSTTSWTDVGDISSGSIWRYYDCGGAGICDDNTVVAGTTLTAFNGMTASAGWWNTAGSGGTITNMDHTNYTTRELEFPVEANGADPATTYYFRMYDTDQSVPVYRYQAVATAGTASTLCSGTAACSYPSLTTRASSTLTTGTDPNTATVAPESGIVDAGAFSVSSSSGTDTISALTVTLAGAGTPYNGLSEVRITSNDGLTLYFSAISNPSSNTLNFSGGTGVPVTTTPTQFKIRVTPKTHANMAAVPGASYDVSPYVSAWTSSNAHLGSDTNANTLTVDNTSPGNVSSTSGSAGNTQVTLNYTTPADTDLNSVVVLVRSGSAVADVPVEGSTYTGGEAIGTSNVATGCVDTSVTASTADSCTATSLLNGTVYHFKIFTKDSRGNYDAGVVPTGSPFTPAAAVTTTVSTVGTQTAAATIPTTNFFVGGAFTLTRASGSANVTSITVTVNSATGLSNMDLYTDTVASCTTADPTTATLFGTNATVGATTVITGSAAVTTTARCIYVVVDVGTGAAEAQTLEVSIASIAHVTVGTDVISGTPAIAGTTTLNGATTASSTGTQTASGIIPTSNFFVGGAFTLVRSAGSANVTSITVTVNDATGLSNMDLYTDTVGSCATADPTTATLFGTNAVVGATTTITGTAAVTTTARCIYVVVDVGAGAAEAQTLEVSINASGDITMSSGTKDGSFPVAISGTTTLGMPTIIVSGTSNCACSSTVRVAVNGVLSARTTTVSTGNWSISSVAVSSGQVVVVWIDNVADAAEATAVAKYDGTGDMTGIILNTNVLSIGSVDNQSLSLTNLDLYDCAADEDVMFRVDANVLEVEGLTTCNGSVSNVYTNETLQIESGDTLAVGGTESVTTMDLTVNGTLSGTGNVTVSGGDAINDGTVNMTGGTFLIDGTGNFGGATGWTFNNLTFGDGSGAATVTATGAGAITVTGTQTIAANQTLNAGGKTWNLNGTGSGGDWWNSSWTTRKKITLDNSASAENLANFPILVKLTSTEIDYAKTQNSGQDLRFVDADDSTVLAMDIETWNEAGSSYVWVSVPQIDAGSTTDYIWMYYNNGSAQDCNTDAACPNDTSVWTSYAGVWHLNEDPSTGGTPILDSTTNNRDLTMTGTMTSGDQIAGQIGGSLDFDGTDDAVYTGTDTDIGQGVAALTISSWFKPAVGTSLSERAVTCYSDVTSNHTACMRIIRSNATGTLTFEVRNATTQVAADGNSAFNSTAWNYAVGVYDGANAHLYHNNTLQTDQPAQTGTTLNNAGAFTLAAYAGSALYSGQIDEVRVSESARSADWLEAEYNWGGNPNTYNSFDTEEDYSSGSAFTIQASGVFTPATSTVVYAGDGAVSVATASYNNLTISPTITSGRIYTFGVGTTSIGGNLNINPTAGSALALTVNLGGTTSVTGSVTIQRTSSATSNLATGTNNLSAASINIATGGTLTAGNSTITLTGTGTPLTVTGTFTPSGTSTVQYTAATATVTATSFVNLTLGGTGTYTLPATTLAVTGGLTVSASATASTGAGAVNITGDLTVTGTLSGSGAGTITVNGAVAGTGTVNISGNTFVQSVSVDKNFGTTSGSNAWTFNNLTFTGTTDTISIQGGTGSLTVAGTLTISASTTLDAGSKTIILSATGTPFVISGTFTANTSTVQYTGATANITITSSGNAFNNLTLGGTGTYTVQIGSTNIKGNLVITSGASVGTAGATRILVLSGGSTQTITDNNGTKTDLGYVQLNGTGANLGSSIKVTSWNTVAGTFSLNGTNTLTITGSGSAGSRPFINSGTFTQSTGTVDYEGSSATDIETTSVTYNNLSVGTTSDGNASVTYTLNGSVTVSGTLSVGNSGSTNADTLGLGSTTLTLSGSGTPLSLAASGKGLISAGSSTVQFTGTSATAIPAATYNILSFLPVGTPTYTFATGTTNVGGNFTVGNGTNGVTASTSNSPTINVTGNLSVAASSILSGAGTGTITVNGDLTGNGTINLSDGTVVQSVASDKAFGGATAPNWTFNNLTFSASPASTITTANGSNFVTVGNILTINSGATLDAGNRTWFINGSGTGVSRPLRNSGVFTASTSNVIYAGTAAADVEPMTYYQLSLSSPNASTFSLGTAAAQTITVNNNFNVNNPTSASTYNPAVHVKGNFIIDSPGTYIKGSGTLYFDGGTTQQYTNYNSTTAYDLGDVRISANGTDTSFGVDTGYLTMTSLTIDLGQTFTPGITGDSVLTFTGVTPLTVNGTFSQPYSTTIAFVPDQASGTVNIPAMPFGNVSFNKAANNFVIGSGTMAVGGTLDVTAGTLDLNTSDPTVTVTGNITNDATLSASSANPLTFSGNFTNNGTFTSNSGTVVVTPAGTTSTINGTTATTNFHSFTAANQAGKILKFKAGNTYGFAGTLTLSGSSAQLLDIQSDTPSSQWFITFTGSASISNSKIKDGGCTASNDITVIDSVTNQGNNGTCWPFVSKGGGNAVAGGGNGGASGGGSANNTCSVNCNSGTGSGEVGSGGSGVALVQSNARRVISGTTNDLAFTSSNTAGNLIVVYVVWDNTGTVSVADSLGNSYTEAAAATTWNTSNKSQIYYAKNILGGSNTITATFGSAINSFGIIYIHEYSGLDQSAPLVQATAATGNSTSPDSGAISATVDRNLIFGAGASAVAVTAQGDGFTSRRTDFSNITEDKATSTTGSYNATATATSGQWVMHVVILKGAGQGGGQGGGGGGDSP